MALTQAKTALLARTMSRGNEHLVFDAALGQFESTYFDPAHWETHGTVEPVGAGRGQCWFVQSQQGHWVLRHYRRGGKVARLSADRYVLAGLSRTRAFREWHLLRTLFNAGLPVPAPVAAQVVTSGLTYRAALITQTIADTRTLGVLLDEGCVDAALLAKVGRCVRLFHDAGVWHADLNAHNVLVNNNQQIFLIDFDRSKERAGQGWKAGNMARLHRSLDKLSVARSGSVFDEALWQTLMDGYS